MGEDEEVFVVKLRSHADAADCFHAMVRWSENGDIQLTLLWGQKAFEVKMSEGELEEMGKSINQPDMVARAEEAFKTASDKYVFAVDEKKSKLIWRKADQKRTYKLGELDATETDFVSAYRSVLDASIGKIGQLSDSNKAVGEQNGTLLSDVVRYRKTTEELVKEKEKAEVQLYERFLPILQAKQDKIAELQKLLKKRAGGSNEDAGEDSYGSDTDVDGDEDDGATPQKVAKMDESQESNSSFNDSQNILKLK